jgi:Flp pilus assembly protein CpaB
MGMKKNMAALLGIAFVVALLATGLFYGLVVMRMDEAGAADQEMVVVAARGLEAGLALSPEDVKLAPRAGTDALVEGLSTSAEVAGLTLVKDVAVNQPIPRDALVAPNSPAGAALGVRPGYRAISIHVADSTGVVNLLQPGHRVDAQVVYSQGERRQVVGGLRTVLQDLEVLKVEPTREGDMGSTPLPVVTLLARPDEADALGVADAAAEIRLLLRHPLDHEITERGKVTLAGSVDLPPAKTPPSPAVSSSSAPAPEVDPQPVQSAENRAGRP